MNDTRVKKEKKQHIQVFVRVRPINSLEKAGKSATVVDVPSSREILVRERPQDKFLKKFTFDKVFGPASKQIDVYNAVVNPLVEEVLAGYNCTVFAYGQTGTGKTFTMEGVSNDPDVPWKTDNTSGIIPRALSHLFDELKLLDGQEYTVRVSFLELYNEEIFDLLSPADDLAKIRLYEDSTKKGTVIIHGLEEVTVHNKHEVYKILEKGSDKRQTAATLMNAHSSRSHTVFSITVHIKESTIDGEELLKNGKLNLVDLAGSENVGRSGAVDRRAREAGSINQSLLTLGRVITALIERTPHVPYRESKLTRLLQESLGGRTKTSIIATISPASINIEETLSTLDYAHRAKNITNRPEINQKLSKKALLQEYTEEIEKLRRDLLATRDRNGVYLAQDNYEEMQSLIDCQAKEIEEKLNHLKALTETLEHKQKLFDDLQSKHFEQANDLLNKKNEVETTKHVLKTTAAKLEIAEQDKAEQKHLIEKHASTENVLLSQVQTLLNVTDSITEDVYKLHDKVIRKKQVEQKNYDVGKEFTNDIAGKIQKIENDISAHVLDSTQFYGTTKNQIGAQSMVYKKGMEESVNRISEKLLNSDKKANINLSNNISDTYSRYEEWLKQQIENATITADQESAFLESISTVLAPKIHQLIQNKIAEDLRVLNRDISEKLDNVLTYTKNSITAICRCGLEERDQLLNDIKEIKENVNEILQDQNNIVEKRQDFVNVMNDVQQRFNNLSKGGKENQTIMSDTLNRINETCSSMNSEIIKCYDANTNNEQNLRDKIQNDVDVVKSNVVNETEKCWKAAEQAVDESQILLNEFQADLSKASSELVKYRSLVECNIKNIEDEMKKNKSDVLEIVNCMHDTVHDVSNKHAISMETHKNACENASIGMRDKMEQISATTTEILNKLNEDVHSVYNRVEKFVVDDLQHDAPTGVTPVKTEFRYPREFCKTSPHERLIQRYKDAKQNLCEIIDEDALLLNNNTPVKTLPEAS